MILDYDVLMKEYGAIPMARSIWNESEYHKEKTKDVTILICQRKTLSLIRLCLESLLIHYPEINILAVDGKSQDDSTEYLRYMQAKHKNVKLWERDSDYHSHGVTMDEAIKDHIETEYVLLLDSDTITMRHGFVEGMASQYSESGTYSTGTLNLVTWSNDAVGLPKDENDIMRYIHPSCSMFHVPTYKTLKPFCDHGAPCVDNVKDAIEKGLLIKSFPVDKYVLHNGGSSWRTVPNIWLDDNDVRLRPFITFIVKTQNQIEFISSLRDKDFDMVMLAEEFNLTVCTPETIDREDEYSGAINIHNRYYGIRFNVIGDYVCDLGELMIGNPDIVSAARRTATELGVPNEFELDGFRFAGRKHWQKTICFT